MESKPGVLSELQEVVQHISEVPLVPHPSGLSYSWKKIKKHKAKVNIIFKYAKCLNMPNMKYIKNIYQYEILN